MDCLDIGGPAAKWGLLVFYNLIINKQFFSEQTDTKIVIRSQLHI